MSASNFRRLRRAELEEVRPQFVRFLAVHGIDGPEWEKTKVQQPDRADALLLQFSQTVFAGVIARVEYLLHRQPHDLRAYACGPDTLQLAGLLVEGPSELDLTDVNLPPTEMLAALRRSGAQLKIYRAERPYRPAMGRDQEIFLLMEQGALIANEDLYELLTEVHPKG